MGSTARYRPISPGSAHIMDPMRASTGTFELSSSYDPYDSSTGRHAYAGYRSDVPYSPSYDLRYQVPPRMESHRTSTRAYQDHGKPTKLKTEYTIRPRKRSTTLSAADSHGRLEIPAKSSVSRYLPDYGRPSSPLTDNDRYMHPISPKQYRRHRNSSSFDYYDSDTGRTPVSGTHHWTYPGYEHSGRRRHPQRRGFRKGEDIDEYDAYSYTNPREQFEKDSAARLRSHRAARQERPLSLTEIEDSNLPRKEPRQIGPPSPQRGFEKLNRDGRRRLTYGHGNGELDLAGVRQRSSPLQHEPDEGYSSYRDDYDDRRLIHRMQKRRDGDPRRREGHDSREPRSSSNKVSVPSVSSSGLGTAVLASRYSDDPDYDSNSPSDRHQSRELTLHDPNRPRRRSRRRVESDSDAYTSDDDLKKYRREPAVPPKATGSESSKENEQPHRHRSRSRHQEHRSSRDKSDSQKKTESGPSKDLDAPPKGILKPPRDKFPEEPNPVREGVAPLKDAHKKGIPPGARWTKIDRRLVNPAALEAGQERFEERPEYVIVLRVLSKEEIQAYAVKTQEIRGMCLAESAYAMNFLTKSRRQISRVRSRAASKTRRRPSSRPPG
ncbi:hypothetical protein BJX61DRAFT_291362 [Aspergillus egyptiacus]|nr:hypothetical protein BJX61DRAFT_291362 [Aspergillus egyptiacus]